MANKILKLKLERDDTYLYWVNRDGNIWRMKAPTKKDAKPVKPTRAYKATTLTITDDEWTRFTYFLDKRGDISRCKKVKLKSKPKRKATKKTTKKTTSKKASKKPARFNKKPATKKTNKKTTKKSSVNAKRRRK